MPDQLKACAYCGEPFVVNRPGRTCCSRHCGTRLPRKPHPLKVCPGCGQEFLPPPKHPTRQHCSHACWVRACHDRFWSRFVETTAPTHRPELGPCLEWTGPRDQDGYGRVMWNCKMTGTHRVAYILTNGPLGPGEWSLHRCDNPPCGRPEHLFKGGSPENMQDKIAKSRQARAERSGRRLHPERFPISRGEASSQAKLTEVEVAEIRRRYAEGGIRQTDLAAQYGVSQTQIGRIVRRERWAGEEGGAASPARITHGSEA